MIDHDRALELAAAALDFALSDDDREALQTHLDGCAGCRAVDARMRDDARAIAGLASHDAPDGLRARILAATATPGAAVPGPAAPDAAVPDTPAVPAGGPPRVAPMIPPRFRRPAVGLAAAAVVALVGGTLFWQSALTDGPDVAVASPSPSDPAPSASGSPNQPGPGTQNATSDWSPVAELTADDVQGGIVALASGFRLASLDGTPAVELAKRLSAEPPIAFSVAADADGRTARITPNEPLTAGALYRFTLTAPDGRTLDSWAFQAHQPLQVAETVPANQATDVPTNTGIEVTFDQDGVVDAASHVTISPKVAGRFEQHGRTIAFVPTKRLSKATIYTVTVTKGVAVKGTTDTLESDVRFRFETAGGPAGNSRIVYRFTNDLFDSATADRPSMAVWADWPYYDGDSDPKPPKSAPILVDRLPDIDAAVAAYRQIRSYPDWTRGATAALVPTKGLTRVASLDAKLTVTEGVDYLWFRLPNRLPAGWYLVTLPAPSHPIQTVLQVSDIAGYLVVSDTKTLVWANDLASKGPVAGATVANDGVDLGRTDADGTRVVATPAALKGADDAACGDACFPVVTIRSGARGTLLPADGGDFGEWFDPFAYAPNGTAYWSTFDTDRTLYRRSDTVNLWGMVRDRVTGTVPGSVTVRLYASQYDGGGEGAPIATIESHPNAVGAYSGSIVLDDLPEGDYVLNATVGADVVGSAYFRIDRIIKPAYRLEVVTGRRVYFAGDQVKVTATATFFEGSPVEGVPLRLEGIIEKTFKTDATGVAIARGTIKMPDYNSPGEPDVQQIDVTPARAEEGQISGVSREIIAYPSAWTVDALPSVEGGRVRITGSVHEVDRERLERELAGGASIWSLDPAGAPVAGRSIRATFTELIPYRIQTGSHYDFIEKKVVIDYEEGVNERAAGSVIATTDGAGSFSASVAARDSTHTYRVFITANAPGSHDAEWEGWASRSNTGDDGVGGTYSLSPTNARADDLYGIGDAIDLTMRDPGIPVDKPGRYLFYTAEQGLRDVVVQTSSRFQATFSDAAPPGLDIAGVRFTGSGYLALDPYHARFRASDRALTVSLTTDAPRYAPGAPVSLTVTTKDRDGRPVPATVVLRAVDEKLFAIGGAEVTDVLSELYEEVGSGIVLTYRSHGEPNNRPEGGDTGGGGDDGIRDEFRDVVLFRQVDTGADGSGVVTFNVADDLTSWRIGASAFADGLFAGEGTIGIPVGLPFFVDPTIATDYLASDRPVIGLRAYGTDLKTGAAVTFSVDAESLGLHLKDLKAKAFETRSVPLPKLSVGTHAITITATTGAGAEARRDVMVRTFNVLPSRLTTTRAETTALTADAKLDGGSGRVDVIVSDASVARYVPLMLDLAGGESARLERTLAAALAGSLVRDRLGVTDAVPADEFDGSTYQTGNGGIAILPYSSSNLATSTLVALVAPDRFDRTMLQDYFASVVASPKATRESHNMALAGLAGLHAAVLPQIRAAATDAALTVRERLILGLGAAALGDAATARAIGKDLVERYGEITTEQARLRVGTTAATITEGTALMAMLAAANGDPLADRFWSYVEGDPGVEAPYALHAVGFVARLLDRMVPRAASFAYTVDGTRTVVDLEPSASFHLSLSQPQFASMKLEPLAGQLGVTTTWRETTKPSSFTKDPDLTISRRMTPSGAIGTSTLVRVDLTVTLGPKAPKGCHQVTDLVPSGLVPVGNLEGWVDPNTDEGGPTGITYPYAQTGQRVTFCAEKTPKSGVVHLRYFARVVTAGTYAWEPTIVESRAAAGRAALTKASVITIR